MREAVKGAAAVAILFALLAGSLAWFADRPDAMVWAFRIGAPIVLAVGLGVFLRLHFQQDEAPDYLRQLWGGYFDRGGFCFVINMRLQEGMCWFDAYYQNRHERPCLGRVALRPAKGLFGGRALQTITFEIPCDAAAFGFVTLPVPIPLAAQGKRIKFQVGASVEYPDGKGRMLRFGDAMTIRHNTKFGNAFGTALTVAGAAGGAIVLTRPASVTLELPIGAAAEIPADIQPIAETWWRLGDAETSVEELVGAYASHEPP